MWKEAIEKELQSLAFEGRLRELALDRGVGFSHNDYLGLGRHPALREAGRRALQTLPAGGRSSRLLGGHSEIVAEAETRIAGFFKSPCALLYSSGYLANLGLLQALAPFADRVASDANNHASLIDGIRLSRLEREIVPHQAWDEWQPRLGKRTLIVAESLYSMDGDFVDETALRHAWEASGAFLVLDEAHAAGVFGHTGRGLSEPWRDWSRMAVVVTFGKAFGVGGGAVLCSKAVRDWMINASRSFIYTTAMPPVVPAMLCAAVDVMETEGGALRQQLWRRAQKVRGILREHGLPIGETRGDWGASSPILPLFVPGNDRALRFSECMRDSGWDLRAIRYPTVPQGLERIRISLNLAVTEDQTESMAQEVVKQWKAFS
jgi:7-keto-8-aminopelargonate synthetase-like enzyme